MTRNVEVTTEYTPDTDIERAFEWLLGYMSPGEWEKRRTEIEQHLESLLKPKASEAEVTEFYRLIGGEDRIGWYLYLIETSQHEPYRTEVHQASRVLPIFKRLGIDLDQLLEIDGIESKARALLGPSKASPDSVMFEMVIALLWKRNGWEDVSFIPASSTEKRPDIRAANADGEWFIETKRMAANSGYSQKEREKWLRMWRVLKDCLVKHRYPFILDIAFHVELATLPDDFVAKELEGKLRFVTGPCHLISNATWDVRVKPVDFEKIRNHLADQYVKCHSRQLQELVGGSWERKKGFTFVMLSSNVRIGSDTGINQYVEDIDWTAGAYWHCDTERATEAKARDIRGHLADAVEQLPSAGRGIIHVGIETPDGEEVEAERYNRIVDTVMQFNAKGKDLRWIYTHLYESYSPPNKAWVSDETVYTFGVNENVNPEPIANHSAVVTADEESGITPWADGPPDVHWLREAP